MNQFERDCKPRVNRRQVLKTSAGLGAAAALGVAPSMPRPTGALAQDAPVSGGTLIAASSGDLEFDPYYRLTTAWYCYGTLYNALYDYSGDDPTRAVPQLAESDEETEDTLTIKLKTGAKFHNGREVTAQDVVDNIARAKDETIGHFLTSYFGPTVASAEAVDATTVKITYTRPYALKRDDLATLFLLAPEEMANVKTNPVGTGPYKFESFAPGDKVELVRADGYWQTGLPYLDRVTIKVIPDGQARIANLLSGDVHLIEGIGGADVARLQGEEGFQVIHTVEGGTWFTNLINCAKAPLDNRLVRQALNYSLDREKINQLAYFGLSPTTQSRYTSDAFWYHEPAATMYSFDLEKAKALLTEAGLPEGFETTIAVTEAIPGSKAMAQVWIQDLATIGVKMEIVEKEEGLFFDDYANGNWDVQAYLLGDGLLDPATAINDSSPLRVENNRAHIETQPFYEEYKQLVADGVATIDPAARKPIYDRVQEIWAEESWAPILAFTVLYTAASSRVRDVTMPPGGGNRLYGTWLAAE